MLMRERTAVLATVFTPRYVPMAVRAILARPRLVMWLEVALVVYVAMVLAAPPAMAAPNPLESLDHTDVNGYAISNYNIEYLPDRLAVNKQMTGYWVSVIWEFYRWGVGIVALITELTVGFKWLEYLTYPIEQAAGALDTLLDQIPGVRTLLIALAVGIGMLRMGFGQRAKGFTEILMSLTAWGISANILVNPVAWLTGDNGIITRTTEAAQMFSAQLINPASATSALDVEQAAGTLPSEIVNVFVRKPHQFVAYGALADGGGCENAYNENLTGTGKELAEAMRDCSPGFGETIENPGPMTLFVAVVVAVGAAVLLGISLVCAAGIMYEVLNMLIAGVFLIWELFRSVGPGGSWRGALEVFVSIGGSVLAVLLVVLINAVYLAVVLYMLTNWDENMIVLFLIIDLLLVVTIVLLIRQRKKIKRAVERMKERTRSQKQGAQAPHRLGGFSPGRHGVTAGLSHAAGSRIAQGVSSAGSRLAHGTATAGRAVGSKAMAPARAVTRRVSRPGFARARVNRAMLHRAGVHDPISHRLVRGATYSRAEKSWRGREARRAVKKQRRLEKRRRGSFYTWAGATRDAEQRGQHGAVAAPVPAGRRPRRRGAGVAGKAWRAARSGAEAATSGRRGEAATPQGRSGPGPARHRSRTASVPDGRPTSHARNAGPTPVPGREGTPGTAAPKDRLNEKMRAHRTASRGPRPSTKPRRQRSSRASESSAPAWVSNRASRKARGLDTSARGR